MFTSSDFSRPHPGQRDAGATCSTPAGWETGAAPHPISPSDSFSNPVGEGRGEASASLALWERVDATWPVIANSPTGLDGDAQRLVRHLLTQAAGKRLQRRRQSDAAACWMWQPDPQMADYVRRWRFYTPGLYRFHPPDLYDLLCTEITCQPALTLL